MRNRVARNSRKGRVARPGNTAMRIGRVAAGVYMRTSSRVSFPPPSPCPASSASCRLFLAAALAATRPATPRLPLGNNRIPLTHPSRPPSRCVTSLSTSKSQSRLAVFPFFHQKFGFKSSVSLLKTTPASPPSTFPQKHQTQTRYLSSIFPIHTQTQTFGWSTISGPSKGSTIS